VSFGAKDLFKLTDDNFASVIKDDWKLRCNNLVSAGAQYVAGKDLDEGQATQAVSRWLPTAAARV
jgi:hypothetical protein